MEKLQLIVADDHPIFRQGVRFTLSQMAHVEVVAEASDGQQSLDLCREKLPDVLLLDLEMPEMDGLQVLERINQEALPVKVVILTSYDDRAYLQQALKLGAAAYVLKDEAGESLQECLDCVACGQTYISPSFGQLQRLTPSRNDDHHKLESLTPTEKRILQLVAAFKTSKEIARELHISHRTVQNHRANICRKLELKGMHQLTQFARDHF